MNTSFKPGQPWLDTDGVAIQAHGGGILYDRGTYYWYGENKDGPTHHDPLVQFNVEAVGISCYTSTDLYNWTNRGLVLPAVNAPAQHDLHRSKIVERPKVVYNAELGRYVMYWHADTRDYRYARVGMALSQDPAGPYTYVTSFAPHDAESRDMTIFQDVDGTDYVLHSSDDNATLYIGRLRADGSGTAGVFTKNFVNHYREAPAIFGRGGRYYLLSSGCTGWDPNPAEYAVSESVLGPWTAVGNPCLGPHAEITFYAQSTFVLPVVGKPDAYIAMFDRWSKDDLRASRYVWLPIRFAGPRLVIEWHDEWDLSVFDRRHDPVPPDGPGADHPV